MIFNMSNDGAKIECGSYTGTGVFGDSDPNTLTFSFAPKAVAIVVDASGIAEAGDIFIAGQTGSAGIGKAYNSAHTLQIALTWEGNSVSWYSTRDSERQLNKSDYTYRYFAIG